MVGVRRRKRKQEDKSDKGNCRRILRHRGWSSLRLVSSSRPGSLSLVAVLIVLGAHEFLNFPPGSQFVYTLRGNRFRECLWVLDSEIVDERVMVGAPDA